MKFECILDFLLAMGFIVQNSSYSNVFLLNDEGFLVLVLYVDYTILVLESPVGILLNFKANLKQMLASSFP